MKTELEHQDIEAIAQRVMEVLKPMLSGNGKRASEDMIFNKKELAQYLNVSVKWIDQNYKQMKLPHYRLKGHVLFRRSKVDSWIESFTIQANSKIDNFIEQLRHEREES